MTSLNSIKQKLTKQFDSGVLPGDIEQLKMAPYNRIARNLAMQVNRSPKPSAVLVLLYPREDEPYFVLTQRHAYKGVHSKQVSFPGGKQEQSDENLIATALREANEEIGIRPGHVEVLGQLTELYIPPSGFLVTPIVGVVEHRPTFQIDPHEVDYIIESPIRRLQDVDVIKEEKIPIGLSKIEVKTPYFDIQDHIVWGATAMILSEFKAILDA